MKALSLLLLVAILPALAAGNASFPIKRSNNSSTLNELKLLTFRTIMSSYSSVFYIELTIGTPPMLARTAFDTLTPLTWLQIPECHMCFPVEDGGSFDPESSYTFAPLSAEDTICSPPVWIPSSNGSCNYSLGYTQGFMGSDILSASENVDDTKCDSNDTLQGIRTDSWRPDRKIGQKLSAPKRPDEYKGIRTESKVRNFQKLILSISGSK